MTTTTTLPGGPAHTDDPATWTIPPTTPDVHAWREQQHAKRGGLVASMRLRNAEKFALEAAHRAAQEKAAPPKPKRAHAVRTDTKAHHARWRAMYEAGMSTPQIAAAEGVPQSTVVSGIKSAGATTRRRTGRQPAPLDPAQVVADYQAGVGIRELARRHHTANDRIRDILTTAGVPIQPRGGNTPPWADPAWVARVNDLLDAGMSRVAVAAEVGASRQQIERWTARRRKGKA